MSTFSRLSFNSSWRGRSGHQPKSRQKSQTGLSSNGTFATFATYSRPITFLNWLFLPPGCTALTFSVDSVYLYFVYRITFNLNGRAVAQAQSDIPKDRASMEMFLGGKIGRNQNNQPQPHPPFPISLTASVGAGLWFSDDPPVSQDQHHSYFFIRYTKNVMRLPMRPLTDSRVTISLECSEFLNLTTQWFPCCWLALEYSRHI